jgi:hypothetical protein
MRIALERNIGDNKMKKLLVLTLLAFSGAVIAGDDGGDAPRNKPFIMVYGTRIENIRPKIISNSPGFVYGTK